MRHTSVFTLAKVSLALLPALSTIAFAYDAMPLPVALEKHELVVVVKVTERSEGRATLVAERFIKGRLAVDRFTLPETWAPPGKSWTPVSLIDNRRYLLMLHLDSAGRPVYSKHSLAESLVEVDSIDDTSVRHAEIVHRLLATDDAAGRTRVLDEAWEDESDATKERLLYLMLQMERDEATVPYLLRCIAAGAPRGNLMSPAAVLIGRHKYEQAAPALLKALEKDDWACVYPAQALAELKVKEAYEPLMKLIESPMAQNRGYFIEALCKLDDDRSIPFLIETARRNLRGIDPDFGTYRSFDVTENQHAVAALGRLRAKSAVDLLKKIAAQSEHPKLQSLAREALQSVRSPQ